MPIIRLSSKVKFAIAAITFPVYLGFGAFNLHPHFVFEVVAYGVAMALLRRNITSDSLPLVYSPQ